MLADYEKLGSFFPGRTVGHAAPLLYDFADRVKHAVCVGMTCSGKTGLCIGILEEAAIDGIPALVIDPAPLSAGAQAPPNVKSEPAQTAAPELPPDIARYFFPVRGSARVCAPVPIGAAQVNFADPKTGINITPNLVFTSTIVQNALGLTGDLTEVCHICAVTELEKAAEAALAFAELPAPATRPADYTAWNKTRGLWLSGRFDLGHRKRYALDQRGCS